MPPKARITKEMIIAAGLEVIRAKGIENLNVRSVAAQLGCSTQPIMYHYKAIDGLKEEVYEAADKLHTEYIMQPNEKLKNPLLSIGMGYISFAYEEKNLFRFIFQSDKFKNYSFKQLIGETENNPAIQALCDNVGLTNQQAVDVFGALFACVHGAASILANNEIEYDEEYFLNLLSNTFKGIIGVIKGGE